ncbi:septum formation family protein [Nakamurella deserti]|uniref:septum formation family protein n=1 Tax=Nakamurella deserti TaxID=2164074 RepID=UPI000DBE1A62|nr:septum formation family protein [Nakamurella deserti]
MDRRISGALLLVLAVLTALVVPRILSPPTVDGRPVVAPPPPAPVVGDCIREETPSYEFTVDGELTTSQVLTTVRCDELHAGEVVRVESALPLGDGTASPAAAVVELIGQCADSARTPGVVPAATGDGWRPDLVVELSVVAPNGGQRAAGQRWVACTAGVATGALDRSFADLDAADLAPAQGSCAATAAGVTWSALAVDCTLPHTVETFGRRDLAAEAVTQGELDRTCRDLIVRASGRPGLLDDTDVTVAATAFTVVDGIPAVVTAPLPAGVTGWATCAVRTADDRPLVGSLRRLGDAPLPWA